MGRNKYQLPGTVRMRTLWLIRDYDRMKAEYYSLLENGNGPPDGQPRGSTTGNPTERTGMKRADLARNLEAIEQALSTVPEEYRRGVWNNIVYRARYPMDAGQATYRRWRARFLYRTAKNMNFI